MRGYYTVEVLPSPAKLKPALVLEVLKHSETVRKDIYNNYYITFY
jgi:hypothetical protein